MLLIMTEGYFVSELEFYAFTKRPGKINPLILLINKTKELR